MKNFKLFLFGLIFLISFIHSLSTFADSDSPSGTSPSQTPSRGKHSGGKRADQATQDKSSTKSIKGVCTIEASPGNPIAGPCTSLVLILKEAADGHVVLKSRTTGQGTFEFEADAGKLYSLDVGSKSYEIISPKQAIHAGSKIEVKLQQK